MCKEITQIAVPTPAMTNKLEEIINILNDVHKVGVDDNMFYAFEFQLNHLADLCTQISKHLPYCGKDKNLDYELSTPIVELNRAIEFVEILLNNYALNNNFVIYDYEPC